MEHAMNRERAFRWLRNAVVLAGAFAAGWWAQGAKSVQASADEFQFQLGVAKVDSTLLVSSANQKVVYVYQGALTGNAALQCTYKFVLSSPGGVIRREQCPVQSLIP
jgi:hypothetical protein